jgi:DNA-binding CsgD family transcriptional regulator
MLAVEFRQHPTFGRDTETRALTTFLERAHAAAAALHIEGPAGIGKTTLWIDLLATASAAGDIVLTCRATEGETPLAFGGLTDLLDRIPADALAALPGQQRHAIDVAMVRVEAESPAVDQRALFVAFLTFVRVLADRAPTLIAIDDVQWIDASSSAVLAYVARRLGPERVGIATTRREGHGAGLPFRIEANEAISSDSLSVGPLDRSALSRMLQTRLNLELPPPQLNQIHRVSGGNPFYALEIGRALVRRGAKPQPGDPFPIPDNLRELVRDRIGQLPASAREVMLAVSALSAPSVAVVSSAVPDWEAGLRAALDAGVLELDGDAIRLGHPLFGSVWYADQSGDARHALHDRLAKLVTDPDEQARHFALAARGPDERVAKALEAAALRTLRRGSPEGAAQFSRQAWELTPHDDADARWRRAFAFADNAFTAGDPSTTRHVLEDLLPLTSDARRRARALTLLASTVALSQMDEAGKLVGEALRIGGDEPSTRLRSHHDLAWIAWFEGDLGRAIDHIRAAVRVAEDVASPQLAEMLGVQAFIEGFSGTRRTDPIMSRALAIEERAVGQRLDSSPARWSVPLLLWDNQFDRATDVCGRDEGIARQTGDEHVLPNILDGLAETALLAGRWGDTVRYASEQHRAALETGKTLIDARALSLWGQAEALQGRHEAGRSKVTDGLAMIEPLPWPHMRLGCLHTLGLIALSEGEPARAAAHLGQARDLAEASGVGEPGILRFVPDLVEALVSVGEAEAAERVLGPFSDRSDALGRRWAQADTVRGRGQILAARGEAAAGLAELERAVAMRESCGQPYELARSLLALGRQQRRSKRKMEARAALGRAAQLLEQLGAVAWVRVAHTELARIGGRAPAPHGLTAGEREVAVLARRGRTNREIAAMAFMSLRTVEAHLSRVYSKLGVRSRTELAGLPSTLIDPAASPDDLPLRRP